MRGAPDAVATNKISKTNPPPAPTAPASPPTPSDKELTEPRQMRPRETPEEFYRRITQRPDIREILRRLAR
jgi:hypothetical protein